jgi:hypothetical protein
MRALGLATLWGFAAVLAAGASGCKQPEVQYEYIYSQPAGAVAVGPASVDSSPMSLSIAGSPAKGAAAPTVTIVESSEFQ